MSWMLISKSMHEKYVCMEWLLSGNVFSECDLIPRTFVIFIHFKCYYSTTHKSDSFQVIRKEHHFWELQSSQFVLTVVCSRHISSGARFLCNFLAVSEHNSFAVLEGVFRYLRYSIHCSPFKLVTFLVIYHWQCFCLFVFCRFFWSEILNSLDVVC